MLPIAFLHSSSFMPMTYSQAIFARSGMPSCSNSRLTSLMNASCSPRKSKVCFLLFTGFKFHYAERIPFGSFSIRRRSHISAAIPRLWLPAKLVLGSQEKAAFPPHLFSDYEFFRHSIVKQLLRLSYFCVFKSYSDLRSEAFQRRNFSVQFLKALAS